MKTFAVLAASLLVLSPIQTQVVRAQALGGALVGGVAGAIIGNNSGSHNAWKGAAIGSMAGALIGAAASDSSRDTYYSAGPVPAGYYSFGYSSGSHYGHHRGHGGTSFGYTAVFPSPAYSSYYDGGYGYYDRGYAGRPSYATSGLLIGGLAGGIIGHNSHSHNGWRGAAIGAGTGLLLGALADEQARDYERRQAVIEAARLEAEARVQAEQKTQSGNTTIINNYYTAPAVTPMSAANTMFGR